ARSRQDTVTLYVLNHCLSVRPPPRTTLFPYTTLFRSTEAVVKRGREEEKRRRNTDEDEILIKKGKEEIETEIEAKTEMNVKIAQDRKSTRLNSSHVKISYAVFCLKKKKRTITPEIEQE